MNLINGEGAPGYISMCVYQPIAVGSGGSTSV